jgi:hypothetical protein
MSADSASMRLQAIDLTREWINHAVTLGCPRVMVNQGALTQENKAIAIAALKTMGEYGKSKGVMVSTEPRGGGGGGRPGGAGRGGPGGGPGGAAAAPNPAPPPPPPAPAGPPPPPSYILLTEVIKASGTYANVDIANFGNQETQQAGIRAMMPFTVGNTHTRLNPAQYDLPAALKIIREEFKYKGIYQVEAQVPAGPDPYANLQATYDVVVANI